MKLYQTAPSSAVQDQPGEMSSGSSVRPLFLSYRLILLGFLFAAAFGIRLYRINEPPLNFHAMRQYHSLLIARGYYFENLDTIPEWRRQVAGISKERQGMLEPQINERLVALGYRMAGGERFWIPRLFSSIYWLAGGIFLFMISRRISGSEAALFAAAFYLFFPFGVVASRSFQPDPLMILCSLASVYAWMLAYERLSNRRWWLAALVSALAILVKFVGAFWILGAFASIGIARQGFRKFASSPRNQGAVLASLLPGAIFYSYQLFNSQTNVGIAQGNILPQMLATAAFWKGWLFQMNEVVGYAFLIGALLGIYLFAPGIPRALIFGLWGGYLVFGLIFSYAVFIHDYWNLALIPIASLSLGPLAASMVTTLSTAQPTRVWRAGLGAIFVLALLITLGITRSKMENPGYQTKVKDAEKVGEIVQHRPDNLYLASDYGLSLEYHGELAGVPWPLVSDLDWEMLAGKQVLPAEQRFEEWFVQDSPRYFIIFDMWEYERQPELQQFLQQFPIVHQTDRFIVFHLQEK